MVAGERVEVRKPFEGEAELFHTKASTFNLNPPRAVIEGNEIVLRYDTPADQPRCPCPRRTDAQRDRPASGLAAPDDRGA